MVDTTTTQPVSGAKLIIVVQREAAYFPDGQRGPNRTPKVFVEDFSQTLAFESEYSEVFFFPFAAFGSSKYQLLGWFIYRNGYEPAELPINRTSSLPKIIPLQPIDPATARNKLYIVISRLVGEQEAQTSLKRLAYQLP